MRGKEIMKVNVQYDFKTEKDIKREVQRFKRFLKKEEMSENTILGYTWTVDYYLKNYGVITRICLRNCFTLLIMYMSICFKASSWIAKLRKNSAI